jgi:hypothetical protein
VAFEVQPPWAAKNQSCTAKRLMCIIIGTSLHSGLNSCTTPRFTSQVTLIQGYCISPANRGCFQVAQTCVLIVVINEENDSATKSGIAILYMHFVATQSVPVATEALTPLTDSTKPKRFFALSYR